MSSAVARGWAPPKMAGWLSSPISGKLKAFPNPRPGENCPSISFRSHPPSAERLRHSFKELVDHYGESEFPIKEVAEQLMTNTIKDEDSTLPGIHPPEVERPRSSIFVKEELKRYGTRSTSALLVNLNKEVSFYEKYLDKEQWRENMVTYQINEIY
ncbi:hypothetical protein PIB30_082939 [Stylosanthes scabra]|uniref:Uncharacterized protein n=1 Tax=Stylosanthes scabra TaxID=79078 RepID=A0ABU6ZQU6_9FABA|nr:hypothetical protein [Stylosanthes scabra]